jgi:hypothetical protein
MKEQFIRLPKYRGEKINGLSRAKIYEVGQKHPEIFCKIDHVTLLDMERFNRVLASYPRGATSRAPNKKNRAA